MNWKLIDFLGKFGDEERAASAETKFVETALFNITTAAICQIGPRLTKIGPKMDHFSMQNRTKSGPKCAPNPDQYHRIGYLPAF